MPTQDTTTATMAKAYSTEQRAIDALVPYPQNARVHPAHQIEKIAASIKEYGFTNPILIDEANGVLAGHGRLMAAKALGMTEVPVIVTTGWTNDQKRAYVIADNRFAELATWDMDTLLSEANALLASGFNLDLAGIDESFLSKELQSFKPELAPSASGHVVTSAEMEKTNATLTGAYKEASEQRLVGVICPECGHEFEVSGE